ncbi:MAG: right-handed parallel beta-helix repeat-containing protein [Deltaproteobacteria bacterium]|nr:right-handed parallel beta-helix repeat-containing protein [Deltaproteobacteria bacterium]
MSKLSSVKPVVVTSSVALLSFGLFASSARAETYEIREGEDLWARLRDLAPGDEVIVHAGTYTQSSRWEATWAGTSDMPIVVRAAGGEARPVLTRDGGQNLMNLHGSYFTFHGFELTGGSHGIRMSDVRFATLEDLVVHDTGDVGISCNVSGMSCDHVTIRSSEIYDTNGTGEGLYLGCNGGACAFSDGTIERNYIHDLGGEQGDGIEIKQGSWGNVIRDNVVVRANYPGITLYSFEAMAGRTSNIIERNLVWGSNDNGIQVTGRAIVRNNVVLGATGSGIAVQANMDTPTEVQILFNSVLGAGDSCIRASSLDTATGMVIANNAVYCEGARAIRITSASSAVVVGNVGLGSLEGASGGLTMGTSVAADLGAMAMMARVYPPSGSALIDAADATQTVSDDFDVRARSGMLDVGAYERESSGMPVWLATEGFKEFGTPMPGVDAGPSTGADAGTIATTDAAIPPGVDGGPVPDAFIPPGVDGGRVSGVDAGASTNSGGCGCRAVARGEAHHALALCLALLGWIASRRRHGRR